MYLDEEGQGESETEKVGQGGIDIYFITAGDDPRFPFEGRSGLLVTGHRARPLKKARENFWQRPDS